MKNRMAKNNEDPNQDEQVFFLHAKSPIPHSDG
jgi:hypothetical protein